jgi:predicted Zn-dependent protease
LKFHRPPLLSLLAGLVLGMGCASPAGAVIDLPSIGEPADQTLSPGDEAKLGASVMSQLRQQNLTLDDPELAAYISALGRRLASFSDGNADGFEFFIVRDNQINAFALPGGHVGINAGLLLAAQDESELAGVLCHEIAHVTQRHVARQIEATKGLNMAAMAAMLVALIASGGQGDVAEAAVTLGVSAAAQNQINFTRAHELEADRIGIRTLASAGYDPNGMADFFQRLEDQSRLYGDGAPEILRSHPVNTTRISEARNRAAGYPPAKPVDETEFRLMQARLRVLSSTQASEALDYYQSRTQSADASEIDRYGLGLAQLRAGQYEPALRIFRQLAGQDRGRLHYLLELAAAQLASPQPKDALATYARAIELYPGNLALTAAYAEALLRFDRPGDARRILLAIDEGQTTQLPDLQRLLAVSAQDLGWQPEAGYRMAGYYQMQGDYEAAINQLQAALRLPDLSANDKARISARLEAYRKEAPKPERRKNSQ